MEEICSERDCTKPARMAMQTLCPTRDNVYLKVWTDERADGVPAKAPRYCKAHGVAATTALLEVLVDGDA